VSGEVEGVATRRRAAAIVAAALPALALALLWVVVERPLAGRHVPATAARRAAVAIRDDVIPFQKWGTRTFTLPYLESGYTSVAYFTESRGDDCRGAFLTAIVRAAEANDEVDVFLLAHGNEFVGWVATLDPAVTRKLRLVYNTGCGDASQSARWLAMGADAYVGHVGESESPIFYVYFLRRWNAGWPLDAAVADANAETARVLGLLAYAGVSRERVAAMIDGSRAVRVGAGDLRLEG
jgi:hypothetical protein